MLVSKAGSSCAPYVVYRRLPIVLLFWLLGVMHDENFIASSIKSTSSRCHLNSRIHGRPYNSNSGIHLLTGSSLHNCSTSRAGGGQQLAYVKYGSPLSVSNVKCGEIVLGTPKKRYEDGTVEVDIGTGFPLTVTKESLVFLNGEENDRLNGILEAQGYTEQTLEKPLEELIKDTILLAKEVPERKRKTHLRPKLLYADDFKKEKDGTPSLSYDIGVGGEIKPRALSIPCMTGRKQPHCWFRDDQMEFIVTDVNTYSGATKGEVWSTEIVEAKRRAYNAMAIEAVKPTCFITSYSSIITQRDEDLLTLQLTDEHLKGLNAYALALPNDKPGDRVVVYLAASDPELQHVYFTRRSVNNERLRDENLKLLYDEIVTHYVKTGRWFRAVFEEETTDSLMLRIVGKYDVEAKYIANVYLNQLPYFSPEGLLNETFKSLNNPDENFCYNDIMINVGKLNYGFQYDNSLFVRIHEYKVKSWVPGDRSVNPFKNCDMLELTTLNICNPKGQLEEVFQKLVEQKLEDMNELKIYSTYPSLVLGQDDGFVYLAINYLRKPNFTLEDDYFVGLMRIVPKSKNIPIGSFVNVRISGITQNQVNSHYLASHSESGGFNSFMYTAFTYWLNQRDKGKGTYGLSRFEEQKCLNLIWMDTICVPPPGSPQYDKFLPLQPMITESGSVARIDESLAPFVGSENSVNSEVQSEPLAPDSFTKSLLRVAQQTEEEGSSTVPIDMENFGSYTIRFDDYADEAMAPPSYYVHNRDIRRCLIEEELNKSSLWKFKRTLEIARMNTEGEIRGFFHDSKGRSLYELLESLSDPMLRRKIEPRAALFFERSVKMLLSGLQDFYLESIYDNNDKEKLVFASIVPKSSNDGDYISMQELQRYSGYIRYDFVMDRETRESLQRLLKILSHPNNSLLSHIRNRHRNIPDDVFFFYRKTLHYDKWTDYKMPEQEISDIEKENRFLGEGGTIGSAPIPPISDIVHSPESLSTHLMNQGLSQVKGLYSLLLKLQRTPTAQIMEKALFNANQDVDERADDEIEPEDVDEVTDDMYMTDGRQKKETEPTTTRQQNVRITSNEWRKLSGFPRGFDREELKQYIRDIKMYKPVHGIKLPIL